jgi:hypothetical protein
MKQKREVTARKKWRREMTKKGKEKKKRKRKGQNCKTGERKMKMSKIALGLNGHPSRPKPKSKPSYYPHPPHPNTIQTDQISSSSPRHIQRSFDS